MLEGGKKQQCNTTNFDGSLGFVVCCLTLMVLVVFLL